MAKYSIFINKARLEKLLYYIDELSQRIDIKLLCSDDGYIVSRVRESQNICEVTISSKNFSTLDKLWDSELGLLLQEKFALKDTHWLYTIYKRTDNYIPTTHRQRRPAYYNYPV